MSHYAVAVFHREDQDVNELLAPYDENIEVEPYIRYTRDEAIKEGKERYKNEPNMTDADYYSQIASMYDDDMIDDDGNLLTTYNPDSKWDWYRIGGRFCDLLETYATVLEWFDGYSDSAKVKNIVFTTDKEMYDRYIEEWDDIMNDIADTWYTKEYYQEFYDSAEDYARRSSEFNTLAVVTPDGKWHEKGSMGWFGVSSETPEEARDWDRNYRDRFIDTADPEWILTIVDCHI